MRCLILFLLALLACNVDAKLSLPSAPSARVPVHADAAPEQPTLVIPPVTVASSSPIRHVLIVGDSEACAVGSVVQATKLPTDDVSVECKVSTRVKDWAQGGRLAAALEKHPETDAVVVFLGTNDIWDQGAPNVQPILDLVTEQGLSCVWVGNTAVHGKRWFINTLLHVTVTPECQYFDTQDAGIPLRDGIHPTPAGAAKWLRAVWPMIPPKHGD